MQHLRRPSPRRPRRSPLALLRCSVPLGFPRSQRARRQKASDSEPGRPPARLVGHPPGRQLQTPSPNRRSPYQVWQFKTDAPSPAWGTCRGCEQSTAAELLVNPRVCEAEAPLGALPRVPSENPPTQHTRPISHLFFFSFSHHILPIRELPPISPEIYSIETHLPSFLSLAHPLPTTTY